MLFKLKAKNWQWPKFQTNERIGKLPVTYAHYELIHSSEQTEQTISINFTMLNERSKKEYIQ